ncbi:MAG: serine hydrolase [Fimbriimonas sp.]|nr:serine hydrolase [Fimbriimonas sp.]
MSGCGKYNFEGVSQFVSARMMELGVPSVAIGVQVGRDIVYEAAFGLADVEAGVPATTRTPYSIASITKPMIATILAGFSERGKVDLDAPVNDYLGGARLTAWIGDRGAATFKRVANHTAGLPIYFQFFFADELGRPPSDIETIGRYGNICRPPGTRYVYSNIGYGILGFAAETVAERPLTEVFRTDLFEPLGMKDAFFAPSFVDTPFYAVRYDKKKVRLPHYVTDHPAASEAYCSVRDLLSFGAFHLGLSEATILTPSTRASMQAPLGVGEADLGYGFGWFLGKPNDAIPIFGHSGGMDGVSTRLLIAPSMETVIVVLCNSDSPIVSETVARLHEALGIPTSQSPASEISRDTPESALGKWSGAIHTYSGPIPIALEIENRRIQVEVNGVPVESDASFEDGDIRGTVATNLEVPDANRAPHSLLLDLSDYQGVLAGSATARSDGATRIGHAISYPATLVLDGPPRL